MTLMSQELVMFFASLIVVIMTTVIMFLPTIIELRKPQDAGPRLITTFEMQSRAISLNNESLDVEDDEEDPVKP